MSLRDEIMRIVQSAMYCSDNQATQDYKEMAEKAAKWDRLTSITEPLAITPLLEDWHDTWSTTCPCMPLVIGNVIVHIGGGCSFTTGDGEG